MDRNKCDMNQKNYDQSPLTDYLTSDKVDEILNEIKNNTLTEWHQFITLMSVFNFEDYPDSFVENILRLMHWLIDQNEAEKLLSIGKYDEFLLVCETEDSLSALEYAVSERNEDIAIRIIRYIKMIEKSHLLTNCPYHDSVGYIAVQTGQIHVVDELVKAGADHHFFCGHYTLLQHAAYIGDIKLALKCITEYCLDVNESVIVKTSPLSIATAQGNFDMVRMIMVQIQILKMNGERML